MCQLAISQQWHASTNAGRGQITSPTYGSESLLTTRAMSRTAWSPRSRGQPPYSLEVERCKEWQSRENKTQRVHNDGERRSAAHRKSLPHSSSEGSLFSRARRGESSLVSETLVRVCAPHRQPNSSALSALMYCVLVVQVSCIHSIDTKAREERERDNRLSTPDPGRKPPDCFSAEQLPESLRRHSMDAVR